jgi:ADP-ribose pyrophosphatase YjhB (NUDIX family)
MSKACDHTSVGMLVRDGGKLLMIERAKYPFGFAVPAGHVDGDATFEDAARRELMEEVGLKSEELLLVFDARKDNPCRRDGGTWHHWKVYETSTTGRLAGNKDETRQARWFSTDEIKRLSLKTEKYLRQDISEDEWRNDPGLEPIMFEIFKELHII